MYLSDIDECDLGTCENGATCANSDGSYSCTCVVGFAGTNCETSKSHVPVFHEFIV